MATDQELEVQGSRSGEQVSAHQGGKTYGEAEMAQVLDVQDLGGGNMGGAIGGGLGAGVVGGLLAGALFGNGGFNNRHGYNNDCGDRQYVTADQLQTAVGTITDSQQNTAVLQGLGDIKAAVPLAEAQVQLALAGSTGEIRTHLGQVENGVLIGQAAINKNISEAIAASLASQNNINLNVLQSSTANLIATKDSQYALATAIKEDGEKTRALITTNQIAELNRLAAERQDEIIELRNAQARDRDRHGIEINMINNQNQNQLQFQAQAQVLSTLTGVLAEVGQLARATNQNLIIGNTGAVATGQQTANPVNVRA